MACNIDNEKLSKLASQFNLSSDEVQRIAAEWNSLTPDEKRVVKVTPDKALGRLLSSYKVTLRDEPIDIVDINSNGDFVYKTPDGVATVNPEFVMDPNGTPFSKEYIAELRSDTAFVIDDINNFETYAEEVYNNPDLMRDLASNLEEWDSKEIDPVHRAWLYNSLDSLVDPVKRLLPKMNIHINKAFSMNGGAIDLNATVKDLYLGIGPDRKNKSALEIYVHELWHAAINYIIESKDPDIVRIKVKMENIMTKFIETTSVDKLASFMEDPVTAKKDAEDILNYISEHGLTEFIPHAMSNKAVMLRLREMNTTLDAEIGPHGGFTYKLVMLIRKIFNKIMLTATKEPKDNDLKRMIFFVDRLTRTNVKQMRYKRDNKLKKLLSLYDRADKATADILERGKDKLRNRPVQFPNSTDSIFKQIVQQGALLGRAIFDSSVRSKASLILNFYGASPEGTLQHILRDIGEAGEFQQVIDNLGLRTQDADRMRETVRHDTMHDIQKAFGRKLSAVENSALLQGIMQTDAIVLEDNLEAYLDPSTGEDTVANEIESITRKLEAEYGTELSRYYVMQSKVLAAYMKTGKGDITLLKNAYNIAHRVNDPASSGAQVLDDTEATIDKLVSLMALQQTNKAYKDTLYKLTQESSKDATGIAEVLMHLKAAKEEAKTLFNDDTGEQHLYIKGYYKDVYPEGSESMVAPLTDKDKLEADGFKLVKVLKPHSLHGRTVEVGFYVSRFNLRPRLNRGALRLTNATHRGFSIVDSYGVEVSDWQDPHERSVAKLAAERDIAKLKTQMAKVIADRKAGIKSEIEHGEDAQIHPMVNGRGEITNFNYEMSREDKNRLLGISNNSVELIAATRASILDKRVTPVINKQIMDVILANAEANKVGRAGLGADEKLYAFIGPDANKKEYRELWGMLPKEVRMELENKNKPIKNPVSGEWERETPLGFHVRRDLINQIFGQKEIQWMRSRFAKNLPKEVKLAMMIAGKIWESIVSNLKGFIILKMPVVLIDNVISNVMLSTITSTNPVTVAKLQLEGIKELNNYINLQHKIFSIETKVKAGQATTKDTRMLNVYKSRLNNSSVKELVDAGFYTQILEETEVDQESGDMLSDIYHKYNNKLPKMIRSGTSLLFLDKNTKYYKFMYQATQFSDFAGRYAQHHLNLRKGMDKQKSINMVKDAFINYNRLESPLVDKLNRMGFLMFTKYYIRIYRFIVNSFTENPLKVMVGLLTLNMLWPQGANPWESGAISHGISNLFKNPILESWDTFNVPLIEASSEIINAL